MKMVLTVLLLYISIGVKCQPVTYGNFKVADQEIIYQKIFFEESITLDKLGDFYTALPYVSDVETSADELKFKINDLTVDYKKFQFTQVATPSIIQTGKYSGLVTINAKDGKYRVTLRSIQVTGDIGYKKITAKDNLTNYACRNSGTYISQDWCKPNMLGLLDQAFTDKLQFVEKEKKDKADEDW